MNKLVCWAKEDSVRLYWANIREEAKWLRLSMLRRILLMVDINLIEGGFRGLTEFKKYKGIMSDHLFREY